MNESFNLKWTVIGQSEVVITDEGMVKTSRRYRVWAAIALVSTALTVWMAAAPAPHSSVAQLESVPIFAVQSAQAQWRGTSEAANRVYAQMPDLPLANDYISSVSGDANPENTFVNRLIRYHLYVQRRSPAYRLDWKITLADYLGLNDWMRYEQYPGADVLHTNPLDGDRTIVDSLTRAQRNQLVTALADIFNPEANSAGRPDAESTPQSGNSAPSASDLLPAAGSADALSP